MNFGENLKKLRKEKQLSQDKQYQNGNRIYFKEDKRKKSNKKF